MMPVLHSTKNLTTLTAPSIASEGIGLFEYTDHYTVFHYGRMPDRIPGKGEATCRMAAFNLQLLEQNGIATHFRRFIAPNQIEFDLAHLPNPDPDAEAPTLLDGGYLVPVQVIVRTELPQGSSVHQRLATGRLTLADLGLKEVPAVDEPLDSPIIEYATMLEDVNRFVPDHEAQRISGLSDEHFQHMRAVALTAAEVLSAHARTLGLHYCDGKAEFILTSDGRLLLADSPGTPDESRLTFNGVHCGKQVLRNWYVTSGHEIPVSRLIAQGLPREQWPPPAPLPAQFIPVMSDLYRSLSQTWTGEHHWDVPDLATATQAVADTIGR
jgi:phosphoribosylaminoimidazole-succinocarboxamide synthase